jgi:hypothetical protein
MKRRIEHARARCQKTLSDNKQKAERKEAEKLQDKESAKTCTNSR